MKICLGYVVWRHIVWGLILQFIFGLIILRWDVGRAVIGCLGNKVFLANLIFKGLNVRFLK